jgi:hypothetical protein
MESEFFWNIMSYNDTFLTSIELSLESLEVFFFGGVCCGSFDFMPPQSLQQWRSKMKKSHIKDKKKQVINDRQAALEKDVRAVMHIIGFRRLSGDQ